MVWRYKKKFPLWLYSHNISCVFTDNGNVPFNLFLFFFALKMVTFKLVIIIKYVVL